MKVKAVINPNGRMPTNGSLPVKLNQSNVPVAVNVKAVVSHSRQNQK